MSAGPAFVSCQGHYAGSVSRFAAYAIDLAASSGAFSLALAARAARLRFLGRQTEFAPALARAPQEEA